jgi:hypothetical protein
MWFFCCGIMNNLINKFLTQKNNLHLCETLNIKSSHKFNNLPLPPIKDTLNNNFHGTKHDVSSINSKKC